MFKINCIYFLILFPIFSILLILIIPQKQSLLIKKTALGFSFFLFIYTESLWFLFDMSFNKFQFLLDYSWINFFNLTFSLGLDGISYIFVLLTTLLIPLCLLSSWHLILNKEKLYYILFLFMELCLIFVFCVRDILLFYIFFESILIPMFILIGLWGSRERKIRAAYLFFLYTLIGSLFMLMSIIYIYVNYGTTQYELLINVKFSLLEQKFLWLGFFASFASKVPMLPVHLWLPEAHVEAPTAGSVLLAGILLKLGSYGFIRYSLVLFPEASYFFLPFIYTLSILGIIYTSLTAIRQTDLKRIIAYTSVAHMNLVMIGIFSFNVVGLEGAVIQSLSHGFVSSALFLLIGVIYDRYHTRVIKYYSGLTHTMPIFSFLFLFFTMSNIAIPGTSSFVGEFLILIGSFRVNNTAIFLAAITLVLGGAYSLWLYNRLAYGNLKLYYLSFYYDLTFREFSIFLPLIFGVIFLGIYPNFFVQLIHGSVINIIFNLYI